MADTTGAMTPTTHSEFVPEVWSKDIQMARTNNLVMANLVDKQYQNDLTYGDTVHIVSIKEMTADQMTPGTALTPIAPDETEQTLVIDKYFGKAIEIQEVLKKQSMYELRAPYTEAMGRAIARQVDSTLLAEAANVAAGHTMTAVAALTFNGIVDAHTLLDSKNVPMEDRALVINAVMLGDLRKLPEFTAYEQTGREGVREKEMGIVGTIYGTKVYLTNAVQTTGGAYYGVLFHRSAFATVMQLSPSTESDRDILKKSDLVSISALWGNKTVRPDHAVVIRRTV